MHPTTRGFLSRVEPTSSNSYQIAQRWLVIYLCNLLSLKYPRNVINLGRGSAMLKFVPHSNHILGSNFVDCRVRVDNGRNVYHSNNEKKLMLVVYSLCRWAGWWEDFEG